MRRRLLVQVIADKRDVNFVLYDQLQIEELFTDGNFNNRDWETPELIVSEALEIPEEAF